MIKQHNFNIGDLFMVSPKNCPSYIFYIIHIESSLFDGVEYTWIETQNPKEDWTRKFEAHNSEYQIDTNNWAYYPVR